MVADVTASSIENFEQFRTVCEFGAIKAGIFSPLSNTI